MLDDAGFFVALLAAFLGGALGMLLYVSYVKHGLLIPLDSVIECITK